MKIYKKALKLDEIDSNNLNGLLLANESRKLNKKIKELSEKKLGFFLINDLTLKSDVMNYVKKYDLTGIVLVKESEFNSSKILSESGIVIDVRK